MKLRRFLPLLGISLSLLVTACSKSTHSPAPSDFSWSGTAPLSFKINGTPYVSSCNGFLLMQNTGGVFSISTSVVSTANGLDTGFSIAITGYPSAGSIYTTPAQANFDLYIRSVGDFSASTGGKVQIISITDSTIEGKFHGNAVDSSTPTHNNLSLTDGYFKLKY